MKHLLLLVLLSATLCRGQYTYWVYDGSEVATNGYLTSLNARLFRDTLFQTLGANYDNGQRVYTAVHSLRTGARLNTTSSEYVDYNYLAGSGYTPLSYHFLPDSGYLVLRANPDPSGWSYPDYIRLNKHLDTLWTSKPRTFNDPFGPSYDNIPLFALPLWDGSLFSVLDTRISLPGGGGDFFRFVRHDDETGQIISDHLWDEDEMDIEPNVYGVNISGGLQLAADSILMYGTYIQSTGLLDPVQNFIAIFDLNGQLGAFKLYDLGNSNSGKDGYGLFFCQGDSIIRFYNDGLGFDDPTDISAFPYRATTRVEIIKRNGLQTVFDNEAYVPPYTDTPIYGGGLYNVIQSIDGGYIGTMSAYTSFDTADVYIMKWNQELELVWYKPLLYDVYYWYNYVLLETPDGGIITGGGLVLSSTDMQHDYFIKLDACGYMVPSDCPEFVNVQEGSVVKDGFKLWPNPSSGRVDAIVPQGAKQLQVFDAQGRCVHQEPLYYPRQTWNLSALPRGVYTFSVLDEHGTTWQQRWVKVE